MLTKELVGQIASASGLSKKDVELLLTTTNTVIRETLMGGQAVQLQGLGTLEIKERNERVVVHPRTGEKTVVPRKNQLVFRPVASIKDELKKL